MDLYPTTKVIFDRRKKAGPKTQGSVELEVYFQRKRKWISTGVKVLPRHWDDRKRVVGRIDAVDLNLRIDALEGNVLGIIRKLMVDGKPFTWGNLDAIGGNGVSMHS